MEQQKNYSEEELSTLVESMCGLVMNKVKFLIQNPLKNKTLAETTQFRSLIDMIAEQILPQYCQQNFNNSEKINTMHNLSYLLAMKVQAVFQSGVIRTCIDQNWDLKGLKAVLLRIMKHLDIHEQEGKVTNMFDKLIQSQNLQSQACIKAISYYLKNPQRKIDDDDLRNPVQTYSTGCEFIKSDIQHFRNQNMKKGVFSVLHPWAYDLDTVDFKYIVNRDLVTNICQTLKSRESRVFWLSFFKSQSSCSADEFFNAIREICEMNYFQNYFDTKLEEFKKEMVQCDYVISNQNHADYIKETI